MKHFYHLLLVLVISSTTASAAEKPVPKFKGKPLAYWIERIEKAETDKEQKEAAEAIIGFGTDAAPVVPRLIEMLDDRSWDFRGMIRDVLIGIGAGAKSAAPTLIQMLKEKTARGPAEIIRVLAKVSPDNKEFVPVLVASLEDPESAYTAISTLLELDPGLKEAVPALIKLVEKATPMDSAAARHAISAFRRLGPEAKQAVPALLRLIEYAGPVGSETARDAIAAAFPGLGAPADLVNVLTKSVKHSDLANAAIRSLIALGPDAKDAVPVIREALRDARCRVRTAASKDEIPVLIELVGSLDFFGPAAMPMLLDFLSEEGGKGQISTSAAGRLGSYTIEANTDAPFRCKAAVALGKMGAAAKQAVPDLQKWLTTNEPLLRACVADALWRIEKDVSVVPVLIAIVNDGPNWSAPAAEVLGEIGPDAKPALPALRKALTSADSRYKQVIEDAIKKIDVERQRKE